MERNAEFRRRLTAGERLVGTFVKTAHPAVIEILAMCPLDFLVLDCEHAPIGREQADLCLLAARAARIPMLVRVPDPSAEWIMTVLDCGAAGIMAPHVDGPGRAAEIAARMRYGTGGRGFSPSVRAASYGGRGAAEHLERSAAETVLVCQIEDPAGAEAAGAIAAVDGVDCLFVGPVDLGIACGHSDLSSPELTALCRDIISVAGAGRAATGMFVPRADAIAPWEAAGGSLFVVATDQAFMRAGATAALA